MPYTPQYAPFDLGAFDAALDGEVIQLLQNPTRAFRQSFLLSAGDDFRAGVALVCGIAPDEVESTWGQYDAAVFAWLFVPLVDGDPNDPHISLPAVYAEWDRITAERVKKARAKPPSGGTGRATSHDSG